MCLLNKIHMKEDLLLLFNLCVFFMTKIILQSKKDAHVCTQTQTQTKNKTDVTYD